MKTICGIIVAICLCCQACLAGMYEQEMIRFLPGMFGIAALFGVIVLAAYIGRLGDYGEER